MCSTFTRLGPLAAPGRLRPACLQVTHVTVSLPDGQSTKLAASLVVVGVGARPNCELFAGQLQLAPPPVNGIQAGAPAAAEPLERRWHAQQQQGLPPAARVLQPAPCVQLHTVPRSSARHTVVQVDGFMRTSAPDVYAVGDCAAFPLTMAGGAITRQEHVTHARLSAAHAVKHILGGAGAEGP